MKLLPNPIIISKDSSPIFKVEHRIGNLNFLTEANCDVPFLSTKRFETFIVNNQKPDIRHRIHIIKREDCVMQELETRERKALSYLIPDKSIFSDPIFRSQLVKEKIDLYLSNLEEVTIQIRINPEISISFYDFKNSSWDFYYVSDDENIFVNFRERHFSFFLPIFSASMVHCAGVARNGRAVLLLAPDEGGKTTTALKAPNHVILSDDQVIIREEDGIINAYGTPWGLYASTQKARLSALFIINKSDHFALTPCKATDVMEYLVNEHELNRIFLPAKFSGNALDILWKACTQAPCYNMYAPLDYVDWNAIDEIVGL